MNIFLPTYFAFRRARAAGSSGGGRAGEAPASGAGSAPERPDEARVGTIAYTKKRLDALHREMSAPGRVGDLMKTFQKEGIDTRKWATNPREALPIIDKHFPKNADTALLVQALNSPEGSDMYKAGVEALNKIADTVGRRQDAIEKTRKDLEGLSENSVIRGTGDFFKGMYNTYQRMSTAERLIYIAGGALLLNHIFKSDSKNTLLKPLGLIAGGVILGDAVIHQITGKTGSDWLGDKLGVRMSPTSRKQLPDYMQTLSRSAQLEKTSEIVAMGKMSEMKMSVLYQYYNPHRHFIEPSILGFGRDEISGEALFKVIDNIVKKAGGQAAFERDFVQKHDFSFLETTCLLYQEEATRTLRLSLNAEQRKEYDEKVARDTGVLFKDYPEVGAMARWGGISVCGVKFHVPRVEGSTYVLMLGDGREVKMDLNDDNNKRFSQIQELKKFSRQFIQSRLRSDSALRADRMEYNESTHRWSFHDVNVRGSRQDVFVEDRENGKMDIVAGDGSVIGQLDRM